MDWLELIGTVVQMFLIPVFAVIASSILVYVKDKLASSEALKKNELVTKAVDILERTVELCVQATNQTYVENLKKDGKFDTTAHQLAFEVTYNAVMNSLTPDVKEDLSAVTTDLPKYVTEMIESRVNTEKK